ncbi:MAG TPA: hypothetical protein VGG16_02935 [Streptosporangiaceae bacterium]
MRSGVFEDYQTRLYFTTRLNRGQYGWNQDEPAVVEAACALAVRRLFRMGYNAELVSHYVEEMFGRLETSGNQVPANRGQTQAIIQAGFWDPGAAISGLTPLRLMVMRGLVFIYACASLRMHERAVHRLIVEAERIAFEQGWNPPLAIGR